MNPSQDMMRQRHLDFLGEVADEGQGPAPQLRGGCLDPAQRALQHAQAAPLVERVPEPLVLLQGREQTSFFSRLDHATGTKSVAGELHVAHTCVAKRAW